MLYIWGLTLSLGSYHTLDPYYIPTTVTLGAAEFSSAESYVSFYF